MCKALQVLIESNQAILATEADAEPLLPPEPGVTVADARRNLDHLATFAKNFLAVLFNVFSETFPQSRGFVLTCIDAFLSITPEQVMNPPKKEKKREEKERVNGWKSGQN